VRVSGGSPWGTWGVVYPARRRPYVHGSFEIHNVLTRKLRQPAWQAAHNARYLLSTFAFFRASEDNAGEPLTLLATSRMSYWDGVLVSAARDAGCPVMLSEDRREGARYGDLEVVNPFGERGPSRRPRASLAA
jgi:predicted nucleic acid-binding protein